jgi:hypothetical protein
MVKKYIVLLKPVFVGFVLIFFLQINAESIKTSPVRSQIYSEFSTIPANPSGKKEIRYFIRIAIKITLVELLKNIDAAVLSVSDSIIQKSEFNGNCTKKSTIPDNFYKITYLVAKSKLHINKYAYFHIVINADCTMISLWAFESKKRWGELKTSERFAKKALSGVFKNISNTYYLGKQIITSKIIEDR